MYMPLPPRPASTRPTMRALIFGAPPHRAEPALNRIADAMYSHFASNKPYNLPNGRTAASPPRRKLIGPD